MAGMVVAGNVTGKAARWGVGKLKNLAFKALLKLKTPVKEGAGKLVSKVEAYLWRRLIYNQVKLRIMSLI